MSIDDSDMEKLKSTNPELFSTQNRLSFEDKCAAYYALASSVKPSAVAEAFNISAMTVFHIKQAAQEKPKGQHRYPDVRREFQRLGPKAFRDRYFSDELLAKLKRITQGRAEEGDKRPRSANNPNADAKSYDNHGPITTKSGQDYRVDWKQGGWCFAPCDERGNLYEDEEYAYRGLESVSGDGYQGVAEPYRTSSAAHNGAKIYAGDRK